MDDALFLSRLQFAVTAGFHFLFPPLSIGLAWLLVVVEYQAWRTKDPAWEEAAKRYAGILGLTFTVGVATGIVLEFQFGTNWAEYSKYVGDVFGSMLAFEAVIAFFMESTFLGLYLFARGRVPKGITWLSVLLVAVGATLSAFWILVAVSWQQTPAGFVINEVTGRAELTSFVEAVLNPSSMPRFFHTMAASLVCGAFLMAAVAAYRLLRKPESASDRKALAVAVIGGLVASVTAAFPTGHEHARQVAATQPEKFAAMEGLFETQGRAPLVAFGLIQSDPPGMLAEMHAPIPGLLSLLAFHDINAEVKGMDAFPKDEHPPLWLTFVSFHNMAILGTWFIFVMSVAVVQLRRKKLWTHRTLLWLLIITLPLTLAACQFGWVAAEVGRQPWTVYKLLRTVDAGSPTVPAGQVLASLIMFIVVYTTLLVLYLFLLRRAVRAGLESPTTEAQEAVA